MSITVSFAVDGISGIDQPGWKQPIGSNMEKSSDELAQKAEDLLLNKERTNLHVEGSRLTMVITTKKPKHMRPQIEKLIKSLQFNTNLSLDAFERENGETVFVVTAMAPITVGDVEKVKLFYEYVIE
jgi:hypothetical protein